MAPNKIIFQLGILAFCVTAVALGVQNVSLMETVSRSFIVFVGVVLTVALAIVASSMLVTKGVRHPEPPLEREHKPAQKEPVTAKRQESAA